MIQRTTRRLFSPLLVFILLLLSFSNKNAFADSFKIHSGIEFGMDSLYVAATEQEADFPLEVSKYKYYVDYEDTLILKGRGTIAGIDNSLLYYFFDDNDKLFRADYHLDLDYNNSQDVFYPLDELLKEKYSLPNNSVLQRFQDAGYHPLITPLDKKYLDEAYLYSSWLIPQDDNSNVLIVHYIFYRGISAINNKPMWQHGISYCHYTEEDINDGKKLMEEKEHKVRDDL